MSVGRSRREIAFVQVIALARLDRVGVLEAFLDLDREISVIGARGVGGEWSHFGPIDIAENTRKR